MEGIAEESGGDMFTLYPLQNPGNLGRRELQVPKVRDVKDLSGKVLGVTCGWGGGLSKRAPIGSYI